MIDLQLDPVTGVPGIWRPKDGEGGEEWDAALRAALDRTRT